MDFAIWRWQNESLGLRHSWQVYGPSVSLFAPHIHTHFRKVCSCPHHCAHNSLGPYPWRRLKRCLHNCHGSSHAQDCATSWRLWMGICQCSTFALTLLCLLTKIQPSRCQVGWLIYKILVENGLKKTCLILFRGEVQVLLTFIWTDTWPMSLPNIESL